MIGIQAMAVIANQTGHTADAADYSRIAKDYMALWQDLAIAKDANPPRTTLSYGDTASHGIFNPLSRVYETLLTISAGLLYNLFADAQLGLDLVPQSVYQMQSDFYPTVANKYGVPLDTRHTYTKGKYMPRRLTIYCQITHNSIGDWECFAAAVSSVDTRTMFIKSLATWINETPTNRPLTDLYDTTSGE